MTEKLSYLRINFLGASFFQDVKDNGYNLYVGPLADDSDDPDVEPDDLDNAWVWKIKDTDLKLTDSKLDVKFPSSEAASGTDTDTETYQMGYTIDPDKKIISPLITVTPKDVLTISDKIKKNTDPKTHTDLLPELLKQENVEKIPDGAFGFRNKQIKALPILYRGGTPEKPGQLWSEWDDSAPLWVPGNSIVTPHPPGKPVKLFVYFASKSAANLKVTYVDYSLTKAFTVENDKMISLDYEEGFWSDEQSDVADFKRDDALPADAVPKEKEKEKEKDT